MTLDGCAAHSFRPGGEVLTFAQQIQGGIPLGALRLTGGQVLERREVSQHSAHVVGEGTAMANAFKASGPSRI
ncbi:hypothetical protein [Deinococcus hopiensis]|uniref:hypothetical protein n=1 Tax=Deinococcus hopiensis TaxID=309885 RepID=UPI00111C5382|nr:hypothetical protein [Deinococcus hopiensis]